MFFHVPGREAGWCQVDKAEIKIADVAVSMSRRSAKFFPAEFSAYVPRLELRRRQYSGGYLVSEEEMILSGLTVVHAPRHRPLTQLGGTPPPLTPPSPACAPRLKISYGER